MDEEKVNAMERELLWATFAKSIPPSRIKDERAAKAFAALGMFTNFDIDDTKPSSLDLSGIVGLSIPLEAEPRTYSLEEILAELD